MPKTKWRVRLSAVASVVMEVNVEAGDELEAREIAVWKAARDGARPEAGTGWQLNGLFNPDGNAVDPSIIPTVVWQDAEEVAR